MYVPPAFAESDIPTVHAAMRATRLASLVTMTADGLLASPVPMLLDPEPAPYGMLLGHLAIANPQAKPGLDGIQAMAIFMGPDAYVSPGWYQTKQDTGKVVPTWNYVAIHAYGTLELFRDPVELRALVARLTDRHEATMPKPWSVDDAPEDFIQGQLKGIIGFRLPIARLDAKWKMSQNRSKPDREGVATALSGDGDPMSQAVGRMVADRNT